MSTKSEERAGDAGPLSLEGTPTEAAALAAQTREVWRLLPETVNDKPERRFVALSPVRGEEPGTFVYGSTSAYARDVKQAASCDIADSYAAGLPAEVTHFYAAQLRPVFEDGLHSRVGRLDDLQYVRLRRVLNAGLSLGKGTFLRSGAAPGSWRGRIVEVREHSSVGDWARYGVVVTRHAHSANRYYQAIVPIFGSDPEQNHESDIELEGGALCRLIGDGIKAVVLSPSLVFSVFHRDELEREAHGYLEEGLMDQLDAALAVHLNCAEPIR